MPIFLRSLSLWRQERRRKPSEPLRRRGGTLGGTPPGVMKRQGPRPAAKTKAEISLLPEMFAAARASIVRGDRPQGIAMGEAPADHPTWEKLVAFDLGRLEPSKQPRVERHVAVCSSCCRRLAGGMPLGLIEV